MIGAGTSTEPPRPSIVARVDRARGGLAVDLVLYAGGAIFAGFTAAFATLPPHKTWGQIAVVGYTIAALVAAAQCVTRRRRSFAGTGGRSVLAVATFVATAVVPMLVESAQRASGRLDRAQEEVGVVEAGGLRLWHTGTPYLSHDAIAALPPGQRLDAYLPYQPGMALFGVPKALAGTAWWTDARIWFTAVLVLTVVAAVALARGIDAAPAALNREAGSDRPDPAPRIGDRPGAAVGADDPESGSDGLDAVSGVGDRVGVAVATEDLESGSDGLDAMSGVGDRVGVAVETEDLESGSDGLDPALPIGRPPDRSPGAGGSPDPTPGGGWLDSASGVGRRSGNAMARRDAALVRAGQAAIVFPICALTLATGGDDMPVLGLCLLALALAARSRHTAAGITIGIAGALKLFAWPVALVLIALAVASGPARGTGNDDRRRSREERWRAGLKSAAGAIGIPILALIPAFLVNEGAAVENVIKFPLGQTNLAQSPAASPFPGHLISTGFPGGKVIATLLLVAAAVAIGIVLLRRPPRTASAAAAICAWGLLAAILLIPSTRFGYLLYPVAYACWIPALCPPLSDQAAVCRLPSDQAALSPPPGDQATLRPRPTDQAALRHPPGDVPTVRPPS